MDTNNLRIDKPAPSAASISQSIDADTIAMLKQKLANTEASRDEYVAQVSALRRNATLHPSAASTMHETRVQQMEALQQELQNANAAARIWEDRAKGYEAAFGEQHERANNLLRELKAAKREHGVFGKLWTTGLGNTAQAENLVDTLIKLVRGRSHATRAASEGMFENALWTSHLDQALYGVRMARCSETLVRMEWKRTLMGLGKQDEVLAVLRDRFGPLTCGHKGCADSAEAAWRCEQHLAQGWLQEQAEGNGKVSTPLLMPVAPSPTVAGNSCNATVLLDRSNV